MLAGQRLSSRGFRRSETPLSIIRTVHQWRRRSSGSVRTTEKIGKLSTTWIKLQQCCQHDWINCFFSFKPFSFTTDANALYLWCTAQDMATGLYVRRQAEDNFRKQYPGPLSFVASEWLANEEHVKGIVIEHARNKGEYRIGARRIPVDGFCRCVTIKQLRSTVTNLRKISKVWKIYACSHLNKNVWVYIRNQFKISGRPIPCTNSMAAGESGIIRNDAQWQFQCFWVYSKCPILRQCYYSTLWKGALDPVKTPLQQNCVAYIVLLLIIIVLQ